MHDWKSRLGELIGEDVEIVVGAERVATVVRSITVQTGRDATYELAGQYHGWEVRATATMLTPAQDDSRPYRADGDIEVYLNWSWQPNARKG